MQCEFCLNGTDYVKIKIHQLSCKSNPNRNKEYIKKQKVAAKNRKPVKWTKAQRRKHSKSMLKAVQDHPESYKGHWKRQVNEFNGSLYDSSWEVAAKKYFDMHYITSTRDVKKRFTYFFDSAYRTYLPDFYLRKLKVYVEVKGMITPKDIAKWQQFPKDKRLLILTAKSITRIKRGFKLGLTKKIRDSNAQIFVDGVPLLDTHTLTVVSLRKAAQREKLSPEERSEAVKQGLRRSPFVKQRKKEAAARKAEKLKTQDARYAGKHNSQYGSYWVTNGVVNKKWKDNLGKLPKSFYRGRV